MTAKAKTDEAADVAISTAPHVIQAIHAISAVFAKEGIAKTLTPESGPKFKYRGVDQVMNALAPLLVEHRMTITPRCLSRVADERQTSQGKPVLAVTVEVEYEFRSAVDGSAILGRMFGEAGDGGDKGTNKALSAAYKYMAFQTFCIPTEGDGDADADQTHTEYQTRSATERQQQRREPDRADFTASLDGAKAAIDLLSTDDGLRKWVDEQAAFLKELPEGPHNELVAYWKARMAKVREPATTDFAAMDYNDQLKTAAGHIAICKTRVDLDKWAAHYQDWTAKIPDDDYNMLNKAWKERHAALAPQQREGFN